MKQFCIFLLLTLFLPLTSMGAPTNTPDLNTAPSNPTVYIIRHGEKPSSPDDNGLSADGVRRAECLRGVFGERSGYNISYLIAPKVNKNGQHRRSYDTILPLARDLGQVIDTSCKRNQAKCVAQRVNKYTGPGDILISWRHSKIDNIARELGVKGLSGYPGDQYDLIWEIPYSYDNITDVRSEKCPGLDIPAEVTSQYLIDFLRRRLG